MDRLITASINYASRIQGAVLTSEELWEKAFKDFFVYFVPRDIVSGDYYWLYETDDEKVVWVAADCTGHGVPGAFMSMLGIGFLNEIVAEGKEYNAQEILNKLRGKIIKSLEQKGDEQRKDGMDIALCVLDVRTRKIHFSGAWW